LYQTKLELAFFEEYDLKEYCKMKVLSAVVVLLSTLAVPVDAARHQKKKHWVYAVDDLQSAKRWRRETANLSHPAIRQPAKSRFGPRFDILQDQSTTTIRPGGIKPQPPRPERALFKQDHSPMVLAALQKKHGAKGDSICPVSGRLWADHKVGCEFCGCSFYEACYPKYVDADYLELTNGVVSGTVNVGRCRLAVWVMVLTSLGMFIFGLCMIVICRCSARMCCGNNSPGEHAIAEEAMYYKRDPFEVPATSSQSKPLLEAHEESEA